MNIAEALAQGVQHQQAGRFADAERIYRQVLQVEPQNAGALCLLGQLAVTANHLPAAVDLFTRAIQQQPTNAHFHILLGDALRRSGNLNDAATTLHQAVRLQPELPLSHTHLGILQHQVKDYQAAEASFRRVVERTPNEAQAWANLGRVLFDQQRLAEAETAFREAVRCSPGNARTHFNLGSLLQSQGQFETARDCYRASLALQPNDTETLNNFGIVLRLLGHPAEAERHFLRALEIAPHSASTYSNLAVALGDLGRHAAAVEACRRAIALDPDFAPVYTNLSGSLAQLGQIDEAFEAAQQAIVKSPTSAPAYCNLGMCLQNRGQIADAIAAYRTGLQFDPHDFTHHGNLIYALNYDSASTPQLLADEHRTWGVRHADPVTARALPHTNDRTPGRRLRVGYVSGHFRRHAVAVFSEPMLAAHDHEHFEIFCYANGGVEDETTARFKKSADHWRDINGVSDAKASELIRADQIDILVDLAGHITGNRLLVFARKPAPIQVTYLGYQNTTGMQAMDYRLTDAQADPPGISDRFYTEQLVRLPRAFFCYRPDPAAPEVSRLPALQNEGITFGSFNHFSKVTPTVLATWAELLIAVPNSRLVLLAYATPWLQAYICETMERHGVRPDRVQPANRCPHAEYLNLISSVDIALDSFPFNGHTTTCDCLWQGVPVVMLAGDSYVSRFGSSALLNLNLTDLVAETPRQYVQIAAELAGDRQRLIDLRATLRSTMQSSPLLDAAGFTRSVEAAYRQMWTAWCASPGVSLAKPMGTT